MSSCRDCQRTLYAKASRRLGVCGLCDSGVNTRAEKVCVSVVDMCADELAYEHHKMCISNRRAFYAAD